MSLIHMDFPSGQPGLYDSTSYMLNGLYGETSFSFVTEDPDTNITGKVILLSGSSNFDGVVRFALPSSQATCGIASRVWLPSLPSGNGDNPLIHQFRTAGNGVLVSILVRPNGGLAAYEGGDNTNWAGGTLLGETSGPALVANAWQHVETKMFRSATVGTVEIRVEGVTVLTLTGQNTGASDIGIISHQNSFSSSGVGLSYYLKDIVYWNGAGTQNNNFLGSVQVFELLTTSDVSFNWGASTGSTGYNLLDESPPNDNTDYIYAVDPAPAASIFGLSNLPADVTTVKGLYAVVRSSKTDGGDGNLQVGMVSGVSTGLGSDRPITTAYTYWTDMFEVDPATSAAWTPIAVDASQLQLDRTV